MKNERHENVVWQAKAAPAPLRGPQTFTPLNISTAKFLCVRRLEEGFLVFRVPVVVNTENPK
jgi:hypothetical protein